MHTELFVVHLKIGTLVISPSPVPPLLNQALQAILSSEALLIKRTRLPVGLSVMALAEKT